MKYTYDIEYTDTFGGQPNYSWCERFQVKAKSFFGAARIAKRRIGLSGVPCTRENLGDTVALTPSGMCTILFITEHIH